MDEHPWQTIIGECPSKANNYKIVYKAGHPAIGRTDSIDKYERSFYMQVGSYRNLMIEGFFELYVRVYFSTMSHDLDNALKAILDCLQHDNKCVKIVAEKFIDKNNPRIEFRLVEV